LLDADCTLLDIGECHCNPNTNSNQQNCQLLPDLNPIQWYLFDDSKIYTEANEAGDSWLLRYPFGLANQGAGPLELRIGDIFKCDGQVANVSDMNVTGGGVLECVNGSTATASVRQIIYEKSGTGNNIGQEISQSVVEVGDIIYDYSGDHLHYHYQNLGIASLRIPNTNANTTNISEIREWPIAVEGAKQHFNLYDIATCGGGNNGNGPGICCQYPGCNFYEYQFPNPNHNPKKNGRLGGNGDAIEWDSKTDLDGEYVSMGPNDVFVPNSTPSSNTGNLYAGLSVGGWDLYREDLSEQFIDIGPKICEGEYQLVLEVNHTGEILESDYSNNVNHRTVNIDAGESPISGSSIETFNTSQSHTQSVPSKGYIITNNTTVTFTGNHTFTENARIVVEKGAKLIIDGAILTTVCDQIFWEGIQVHGDSSVPHPATVVENGNYPDHGMVIIKNNSIIENANNAVKTMKVDNYGTDNQGPDHSNRHGIVIIENAEFYNNICGVVLFGGDDITATTASKINNARFTIDDAFHSANFTHNPNPLSGQYNHDPDFQVFLKEVSGVRISLSTFDNQATKISGKLAMRVEESTFALMDSEVKNFDKGIEAIGSSMTDQAKQIFISNNTFSGNDASVHISGYNQDVSDIETYDGETSDFAIHITNENVFDVPLERQDYSAYVAVFLDGCSDYIISNNDFTGGFSNSILLSSVRIENSDDNTTNYIQNNDFLSQQTADIFAHFTNPSAQILCNTFFGNSATGIFTMGNTGATDDVIDPIQGSCLPIEDRISDQPETYPTGNILSTAHTQFASSFHGNFQYNYYPGERPSGNLPGNIMIPNNSCSFGTKTCDFTNEVVETDENDPHSENVCCDCARVGKNLDKALELNKYIEQDKALLTKYNRKEESAFIEAATDISKIKSIIEQYDVYLSNNELKAVAQKLGSLPPVDILNILIDNAPLETEVKSVIQDHLSALPVFTANFLKRQYSKQFQQLLDQTNGLSLRLEKEFEVKRNTRAQKILWQGPILVGPDIGGGGIPCRSGSDIKQYIAEALVTLSKNTVENKKWFSKKAIEYCIETGQNQYAKNILSDFKSDVNNVNYILLEELKIRLKEEKRNLNELRPDEISLLKEIEGDLNIEGILARNALAIYNESSLPIDIPKIPDENLKKSTATINTIGNDISNMLDLWPNPSSEVVNINLGDIYDTAAIIKINIFDHAGKFIKKIDLPYQKILKLSIMDLEEGAYIINVTDENNNKQGRAKLLIIR